jgi:DNA repair photolyase
MTTIPTNHLFSNHFPEPVRAPRGAPLLKPAALPDHPGVFALDLVSGNAQSSAFWPTDAFVEGGIFLVERVSDRLAQELDSLPNRPRAIIINPSSDPFADSAAVQNETLSALRIIAGKGIESWMMTRGRIDTPALDHLADHRDLVKLTVGLASLDPAVVRTLEPCATAVENRVAQIRHLKRAKVAVDVALEPLVFGLTDLREHVSPMLEMLASSGISQVCAGYLAPRLDDFERLAQTMHANGLPPTLLESYETGPVVAAGVGRRVRLLPKLRRQQGYANLMALAAEFGMTIRLSRRTNPDFRPTTIANPASVAQIRHVLMTLKQQISAASA